MPRVATNSSRSHTSPASGKTPPCPPLRFPCPEQGCPWSYDRQSDLKRHSVRHMSPEEKSRRMYACPEIGCTHKALQKSNLATHYNAKHSGLKPHICTKCSYCAADPSCLHKHMRTIHGYVSGTQPRKKRSAAVSELFDTISSPFAVAVSSSGSPGSSGSRWTASPSPAASFDSLPSPLSPAPSVCSSDDCYSFPTTPDAHAIFYPYMPSPASSTDSSMPPSSTVSDDWMWDPSFEAACQAMGDWCASVPPTALPAAPAMFYPAENMGSFASGCGPSDFFPASFDITSDPFAFPSVMYDISANSCSYLSALEGQWTDAVY
ncbi:hypothetical protein DFH07DRAFT_59043 [Mycena maculata]|uniref:C2H2-type domain-containing protein n=1 Tax=Mycena maculata TaxID=230809 RepID=A0AAD7IEX0_9AGAR|nr:hypothetical protein DFH07DRAFT_59043 [Mycena maculata]